MFNNENIIKIKGRDVILSRQDTMGRTRYFKGKYDSSFRIIRNINRINKSQMRKFCCLL